MSRFLIAIVVVALVSSSAAAGPFGRRRPNVQAPPAPSVVRSGGSAQAHAEAMAASGSLVHASNHPGYEGVGTGGTPDAAVASCCTNGGAVIDQGVAFGHGRWWACVRRR